MPSAVDSFDQIEVAINGGVLYIGRALALVHLKLAHLDN